MTTTQRIPGRVRIVCDTGNSDQTRVYSPDGEDLTRGLAMERVVVTLAAGEVARADLRLSMMHLDAEAALFPLAVHPHTGLHELVRAVEFADGSRVEFDPPEKPAP
jgi:hypothetical protein